MKTLLGSSPITSILGAVIAALTAGQTLLSAGTTNYYQVGIAVLVALLGRFAADASTTPKN